MKTPQSKATTNPETWPVERRKPLLDRLSRIGERVRQSEHVPQRVRSAFAALDFVYESRRDDACIFKMACKAWMEWVSLTRDERAAVLQGWLPADCLLVEGELSGRVASPEEDEIVYGLEAEASEEQGRAYITSMHFPWDASTDAVKVHVREGCDKAQAIRELRLAILALQRRWDSAIRQEEGECTMVPVSLGSGLRERLLELVELSEKHDWTDEEILDEVRTMKRRMHEAELAEIDCRRKARGAA